MYYQCMVEISVIMGRKGIASKLWPRIKPSHLNFVAVNRPNRRKSRGLCGEENKRVKD